MTSRNVLTVAMAFAFAGAVLAAPEAGHAGINPRNKCVSAKMKAAGKHCKKVLKAWSVWDKKQDDDKRDEKIGKAETKLGESWDKAEEKAADKGVDDCDVSTATSAEVALMVGTAAAEIVAEINNGLVLGKTPDGKCGSKFLNVAAKKCQAFLKAESKHVKKPDKDVDRAKLDENKGKASQKFDDKWIQVESLGCTAGTSAAVIEQLIDEFSDDAVFATTTSPNTVPGDAFMAITHPAGGQPGNEVAYEGDTLVPQCQDSSSFSFFAKRGSVNKLLVYYHGGGACWDNLTCGIPTCNQNVGTTPPGLSGSGFGDFTDPDNPFKDWHVVQVPYCGCDIHVGDNAVDYPEGVFPAKHVEHRGYDNAKLAEKWAREHFVNPSDIFLTGSSAGSYGAMVHGAHLSAVYPAASINVMGDGGNGVATQEFMDTNFNNWGAMENLPDIPGIVDVPSSEITIPLILDLAADFYPRTNWSNYTTAFDGGGGGQTGFYNVMLNPENPIYGRLNWHEASCEFNQVMRQQAYNSAAAAPANYRYYIASGSRHTGFGNPRVYYDTTGGVPTLVDWVNAMINDDPAWVNVEASPYNVLFTGACNSDSDNPGTECYWNSQCPSGKCSGEDVKPNPLVAPFEQAAPPDGPIVVNCP